MPFLLACIFVVSYDSNIAHNLRHVLIFESQESPFSNEYSILYFVKKVNMISIFGQNQKPIGQTVISWDNHSYRYKKNEGGYPKMSRLHSLFKILPPSVTTYLTNQTEEIRFRRNRPVMLLESKKEILAPFISDKEVLDELIDNLTQNSLYTYFDDISQGYLTIEGGHRVGICGTGVYENGRITHIKDISSLNFRIAHEIKGCAESLYHTVIKSGSLPGVLIISPPGCGKTTLLRDFVRLISDRMEGSQVALVDERSELAGVHLGEAQNDLGKRTDILNGYQKSDGIRHAIRALSPTVIAVDEIGTKEDEDSLLYALHAGVTLLATVHGDSGGDFQKNIRRLTEEKGFQYYVYLSRKNPKNRIEQIVSVREHEHV